ncbi:condensation domain-containing protein [Nonomuraea sp. NPDC050404]|uniref:condensation domain-containing protein n=1 Tax=Nonomuraea sp. NPDC050404 TaxID=3155783 RepID=UPI0034061580
MNGTITPSWNQRSRLARLVEDAAAGLYRPQHTISALRVRGELDLAALNRAWLHLQRRHPVLLTSFDPGKPLWRLDPVTPVELVRLPPLADAQQALLREAERPFDIERGPLARLVAIPLSGTAEMLLGLVIDHLVSDAWSRRILVGDLYGLYNLEIGVSTEPLPKAPAAYAGWVERQNDYVQTASGLAQRRIARQLVPPRPEPAGRADVPRIMRELGADLYERLRPAARRFRLTRLQLVLAALDAALGELGEHWPAGTLVTVAGRPRPDLHGSVGWFADYVPVLVDRGRRADPGEHVRSFREAVVSALDLARVPWPLVVADALPDRFTRPMALPFLSFNAQPLRMGAAVDPAPFAGTEVEEIPVHLGRPDGTLLAYCSEHADGSLRVALRYQPERYDEAEVLLLWQTAVARLDQFAEGTDRRGIAEGKDRSGERFDRFAEGTDHRDGRAGQ